MTFLLVVVGLIAVACALAVIHARMQPRPPEHLSDDDIRAELRKGNRIVAIRWYRTLHGVGLKHATEALDEWERESSDLRVANRSSKAAQR